MEIYGWGVCEVGVLTRSQPAQPQAASCRVGWHLGDLTHGNEASQHLALAQTKFASQLLIVTALATRDDGAEAEVVCRGEPRAIARDASAPRRTFPDPTLH